MTDARTHAKLKSYIYDAAPEKVISSLGRQLELETYLTKIELSTKRPHHLFMSTRATEKPQSLSLAPFITSIKVMVNYYPTQLLVIIIFCGSNTFSCTGSSTNKSPFFFSSGRGSGGFFEYRHSNNDVVYVQLPYMELHNCQVSKQIKCVHTT